MESNTLNTEILRRLKFTLFIIGTLVCLQGCVLGIGGGEDESEEPDVICDGITNDFDESASRSDCLAVGREWIEGEGCYCGTGE